MMAKRVAGSELNADNWDHPDEVEERGHFKAASADVIANRVIKKAVRKNPLATSRDDSKANPFSAFSGFASGTTSSMKQLDPKQGTSTSGGLFQNLTTSSDSASSTSSTLPKFSFGLRPSPASGNTGSLPASSFNFGKTKTENKGHFESESFGASGVPTGRCNCHRNVVLMNFLIGYLSYTGQGLLRNADSSEEFFSRIGRLCEALLLAVKRIDPREQLEFTPPLVDYWKQFQTLLADFPNETKKHLKAPSDAETTFMDSLCKELDRASGSEGSLAKARNQAVSDGDALCSLNQEFVDWLTSWLDSEACIDFRVNVFEYIRRFEKLLDPAVPLFSTPAVVSPSTDFSASTSTATTTAPSKPSFTFGFASASTSRAVENGDTKSGESKAEDETEEDQPPPQQDFEVKLDGAFMEQKCKLFYRSGSEWKEKGVGMLFLKKVDDKTQLVIRANNALATILLNIVIPAKMPVSRQKNSITLVSAANPPIPKHEGPVTFLIRVKLEDDAKTIEGHLKSATS